jgi:signal transduction histidine kinase
VLLDTIVGNLVENAGRYAPPPAPLAISAVTGNGLIRLVVEDGGPGVPAPSLPRLFDKFYRVDRMGGGSRRGLGIGLAVVRGLAEGMGGTVEASPSPLGGLRIVVELPVAATPPGDEASSVRSALVSEREEAAGSGAAIARTPR